MATSSLLLPASRTFLDEESSCHESDVEIEDLIDKYAGDKAPVGEAENSFELPAESAAVLAKEVSILRLRQHWDPKRFYKSMGNNNDFDLRRFQLGTVIEAPHEFYTAERLRRRERKPRLFEEVMEDQRVRAYVRRRFRDVQERAQRTAEASRRRRRRRRQGGSSKRSRRR
ncbi:hypothetical protein CCYA_CCYA02G0666 [Cyanidiococcus yangmingshanensis]|nr:hypothetical protein CCYA_CCYA02G0666 [Cyanidiococcus yangmingshanensis]